MKKEHLLAILVVFVIVVWWSIRPKDIAVIVTDINKTPYIDISVYMIVNHCLKAVN